MVSHDDRVGLQVAEKLDPRPLDVSVHADLQDFHVVHFVHGPDVVEEIRRSEPGVRFRDVVGGAQHVPGARVRAGGHAGDAAEERLDRRDLPERGRFTSDSLAKRLTCC
jgi:hypothetical protein